MQPLTIYIIDNNIVECSETFSVTMTVTTCGVTHLISKSIVMINDDDGGKYKLSIQNNMI